MLHECQKAAPPCVWASAFGRDLCRMARLMPQNLRWFRAASFRAYALISLLALRGAEISAAACVAVNVCRSFRTGSVSHGLPHQQASHATLAGVEETAIRFSEQVSSWSSYFLFPTSLSKFKPPLPASFAGPFTRRRACA